MSTILAVENADDETWDGRERATKKLLAVSLRTSIGNLDRIAKGEIDDAPVEGQLDISRWIVSAAESGGADVLSTISPIHCMKLARVLIDCAIASSRDDLAGPVSPKSPNVVELNSHA